MICVDASLVAKLIFDEEHSPQSRTLCREAGEATERIVAPPLLPIEVTNVVRQRMRRAKPPAKRPISMAEAREALELFLAHPIELAMPQVLHRVALELAHECGLMAVYDAHYIALAQTLGCPFWTADRRLVEALQDKLDFVRWIGDYGRERA